MTRKAMNFLAKRLRDAGELPRSLRQVKAEFRKTGEILPPYEQTDDPPTAHAPLKKSQSYDPTQGRLEMSRQTIFRGYDIEHVNGSGLSAKTARKCIAPEARTMRGPGSMLSVRPRRPSKKPPRPRLQPHRS
jgi:hypothetical protein